MWLTLWGNELTSSPQTPQSRPSEQPDYSYRMSGSYMVFHAVSCPTAVRSLWWSLPESYTDSWASHYQQPQRTTHRRMDRRNMSTRNWNNTFGSLSMSARMTGMNFCPWWNSSTTTISTPALSKHLSSWTQGDTHAWALNPPHHPDWKPLMSSRIGCSPH